MVAKGRENGSGEDTGGVGLERRGRRGGLCGAGYDPSIVLRVQDEWYWLEGGGGVKS